MTFRTKLTIQSKGMVPPAEVKENRQQLCNFLRQAAKHLFSADAGTRNSILKLLGWDDETFHNFINSPFLINTSPHASMNAFPPMFCFPWVARCIQKLAACSDGKPMHVRTLWTHNKLSDPRWRPRSWWHRDRSGAIQKQTLFSGHRKKWRQLALLGVPRAQLDVGPCSGSDMRAIELANHALNFGYFCMIYRIALEREGDLHEPGAMMEIPVNILNACIMSYGGLKHWLELSRLNSSLNIWTLSPDGKLTIIEDSSVDVFSSNCMNLTSHPIMCSAYLTFAQIYFLGVTCMVGAEKMASYVPEMNGIISDVYNEAGWNYGFPKFIPITQLPWQRAISLDMETENVLKQQGIPYSLPIAVADHGAALRSMLDTMLDLPCDENIYMPLEAKDLREETATKPPL